LTTVRLLSEKTNGIAELAYVNAVEGRIVPLAVLLVVAAEKVNEEMVLELGGGGGGFNKEKMTIYEGVIRKTLHETTASSRAVKLTCSAEEEVAKRRKLLLREIELLQLFGAVACSGCTDKKVTSPLIRASQVRELRIER
jgi:Fe-S cluster biogenesis protein NfuA